MIEAKGQDSTTVRMGSGPVYKIFPCKGGYVRLVIMAPRQWHAMRDWLGEPDYLQDPPTTASSGACRSPTRSAS